MVVKNFFSSVFFIKAYGFFCCLCLGFFSARVAYADAAPVLKCNEVQSPRSWQPKRIERSVNKYKIKPDYWDGLVWYFFGKGSPAAYFEELNSDRQSVGGASQVGVFGTSADATGVVKAP
ncbi:MAG: hypothetical protein C5B49_04700 [Bdellovibrio sp.]|nr:MAG: hypothetical protein C5B49_04700 [Bdellovibrio sp.]